jgi:aryl-alcohol dehydrogenase-like predicted oxidoreductase
MDLKPRKLGNSDLVISPLGIGTWAMGGDWQFGWGPQDDEDSVSAILRAVDLGANWIDTAPAYGLGHAEHVVGRAIAELGSERPFVFTKCGMVWDENGKVTKCLSASSVRKECESSLLRLGLEAIDLLQIHWPTGNPDDLREVWGEMGKLKSEGKVRYLGVCNLTAAQAATLNAIHPVTSIQSPLSLLDRGSEDVLLPFAGAVNIGFLAYSPLASGLLVGKFNFSQPGMFPERDWRSRHSAFQGDSLAQRLKVVRQVEKEGRRIGCSMLEISLGWVVAHRMVSGAIVGIRNETQARANFSILSHLEEISAKLNCLSESAAQFYSMTLK